MVAELILNVNDSPSSRYYVSRILKSAGWQVLEVGSGEEALAVARVAKPDAIILDIRLPDISGLEVCRRLRADPETANIIVIHTSATFVTSEGKARGLESGANQYLTQPFESIELIAMVKNLLALRQSELEAKRQALALAEADKRKDEFLAMLAHELRNPLGAISSAASLFDGHTADEARVKRLALTITRQAAHLSRLVDDLLDVSRVTRGKIQLRPHQFELGALVRSFMESAGGSLTRFHELRSTVSSEPMWIDGDATRIEQVLSNLLGNAAKYTARGGRIDLSVDPEQHDDRAVVVLRVRDGGVGIAARDLAAIFDLFFQVDGSLARSQSGLGIGLTMVKNLVEMHGGTVRAASAGLGLGSEFCVVLPLATPVAVPERAVSLPPPSRAKLRLLIIDDNQDLCELQAMWFEQNGHDVESANDGHIGLQQAVERDYDVAVIDIGLPSLDGYEVARRVRAARSRTIALVALSGYGRAEDKARALEAGFDAHVTKPVNVHELLGLVEKLGIASAASR